MQKSPYTPGSVAKEVPGRTVQLANLERELTYLSTLGELAHQLEVFVGPRGVGKTSLLRAAERTARQRDLETVWVTAGEQDLGRAIVRDLHDVASTWEDSAYEQLKVAFRRLSITLGPLTLGAAEGSGEDAAGSGVGAIDARSLQKALLAATRSAISVGKKGLVIFVDEIQVADAEGLRSLGYAWQHLQAEHPDVPMMAVTAGLSHSQDVITDAVSFSERFHYQHLGNLNRQDSATALLRPAQERGVEWSQEALAQALEVAEGYPYFVQVIGAQMWRAAGDPDPGVRLGSDDFVRAEQAFRQVQRDFFRARWAKSTPREAEMLRAMVEVGGTEMKRGEVAAAMGTSTTAISEVRRSLMNKGLIEAAGHGVLRFTAPGFGEYIREEVA